MTVHNKGPAQGIRCARAAQLVFEIMQKTRVGGRRTACPYDNSYKSEKQINKQKLISYGHLFGTKKQSRIKKQTITGAQKSGSTTHPKL